MYLNTDKVTQKVCAFSAILDLTDFDKYVLYYTMKYEDPFKHSSLNKVIYKKLEGHSGYGDMVGHWCNTLGKCDQAEAKAAIQKQLLQLHFLLR